MINNESLVKFSWFFYKNNLDTNKSIPAFQDIKISDFGPMKWLILIQKFPNYLKKSAEKNHICFIF